MAYYAVRRGRKPGIYESWEDCLREINAYPSAEYKKFKLREDAEAYMLSESKVSFDLVAEEELEEDSGIAYVDGSYSQEKKVFSYGLVYIDREDKIEKSAAYDDEDLIDMRNVAGELVGAAQAYELAIKKGKKKLYLHYDYEGIEKWASGEWKTNRPGTKRYKDYYQSQVAGKLEVKFIKVAAHTGVEYNELADKLAKEAISQFV